MTAKYMTHALISKDFFSKPKLLRATPNNIFGYYMHIHRMNRRTLAIVVL